MAVPTEFYRWWITDERTGKRRLTTYKLTRADAAHRATGCLKWPEPAPRTV